MNYIGAIEQEMVMDIRPMKVIPHPTRKGFWTIQIGDSIYGEFDRRELAIAIMLTR